MPPQVAITDVMLQLAAFRAERRETGSAALGVGETAALYPITEFGAKPYTEDEEREFSEIVQAFNARHGADFTEEAIRCFERVNRDVVDAEMAEMLRNNPPDVVYNAFATAFFQGGFGCSRRT